MKSPFEVNYRTGLFWITFGVLALLTFLVLRPFFPAILWATVLSILIWPLHVKFTRKLGPNGGATASVVATMLFVILPLGIASLLVATQLKPKEPAPGQPTKQITIESVLADLDEQFVVPNAKKLNSEFSLSDYWSGHKSEIEAGLADPVGKAIVALGTGALTVVIALLTQFFMLRDGPGLRPQFDRLIPLARDKIDVLLNRLYNTVRGVFIGVILVALVQGALATGLYFWAGTPSPLIFGVVTTVLCIIPLLGAPVIYIPLGLTFIMSRNYGSAAIVLIGGFLVVSQIDNVIKPFLIGNKIGISPMGVFFSILGGIIVFGPVGLMVGPMLLATILFFLDLIAEMRSPQAEPVEA
ncbi:MAG: AI-2E family transporter [Chthonomonas sp.]|nr:AI-2E family transporter [Chthonomonas sp.]